MEDVELRVIDQALAEELFFERSSGRIKESRELYAFPAASVRQRDVAIRNGIIQKSAHPLTSPAH